MSYFVRVLSTSSELLPFDFLQAEMSESQPASVLSIEGDSDSWNELLLSHSDGVPIAAVERNPVEEGSLASEELQEFEEEVADCQPSSAAVWLRSYFPKVRCIYAFQCLSGTDERNGWEILDSLKSLFWNQAPSILQSDGEGFSNEEGYHILWQLSDSAEGEWAMGVLENGEWKHFSMNLEDPDQRASFLEGHVPAGVTLH